MSKFSWSVPAKINLGLNIHARLADGYHQVETVMIKIPLFDEITFSWLERGEKSTLSCAHRLVPNNSKNLILKAFSLLQKDFDLPPAAISLSKKIPIGAGLGGGSCDAGVLLYQLNQICHLGLSLAQLQHYGLLLGADVPFAILPDFNIAVHEKNHGLPTLIQQPVLALPPCLLVLCTQSFGLNTTSAYQQIDASSLPIGDCRRLTQALADRNLTAIATNLHNDFSASLFQRFPLLLELKNQLLGTGALGATFTGKGPSLFALFPNDGSFNRHCLDRTLYHQLFTFKIK